MNWKSKRKQKWQIEKYSRKVQLKKKKSKYDNEYIKNIYNR